VEWYGPAARDLPWRQPGVGGWPVLVSEVMLQQTPVARVLPVYQRWLGRWPAPAALAAAGVGDAVREWGTLGYPRRAVRLHQAAGQIAGRHGGRVPAAVADLLRLPGVGEYTARAVATFAYGQRHAVLDTNIRRVLGRVFDGRAHPGPPRAGDRQRAGAVVPESPPAAARYTAAVMELGALLCRARRPGCDRCPVHDLCAWRRAGRPEAGRSAGQRYAGTDRQARGRLLATLRSSPGTVPEPVLRVAWPPADQRRRALAGLVADGLAVRSAGGYRLPD
jgi:A/G-specific adenine glycosylase